MSDQFGNNVDGEIWIDKVEYGAVKDGSQKPVTEYALAYADGSVEEESNYWSEGEALQALQRARRTLFGFGIPEEYHPILMVREVTTTYGSWRPRSE